MTDQGWILNENGDGMQTPLKLVHPSFWLYYLGLTLTKSLARCLGYWLPNTWVRGILLFDQGLLNTLTSVLTRK